MEQRDNQQLRYLSLTYYAFAALGALGTCLPVGFGCLGIAFMAGLSHDPDADEAGVVMLIGSVVGFVVVLLLAGLTALNGFLIARRSGYGFCIALAVLACLNTPFGTILGVLTLIVLMRDSVREQFGRPSSSE